MGYERSCDVFTIQRFGENSNLCSGEVFGDWVSSRIDGVLGGQEHRTGGKHDGRVVDEPIVIPSGQSVNRVVHEGGSLGGEHEIVRDTNLRSALYGSIHSLVS